MKVYPVDLMRLYLTRRNLDAIAGIDLAGITPLVETTVKLGDGARLRRQDPGDRPAAEKEGAYLVMVRGDDLLRLGHRAGLARWSWRCSRSPTSGRVRVTVRDAATKDLVPKVQVKVIGTDNPTFFSGETDLRGVFVAEGVQRPGHGRGPQGRRRSTPSTAARRHVGAAPARPRPGEAANAAPASSQRPAPNPGVARQEPQGSEHLQPDAADRPARTALSAATNPKGAAAGGFK